MSEGIRRESEEPAQEQAPELKQKPQVEILEEKIRTSGLSEVVGSDSETAKKFFREFESRFNQNDPSEFDIEKRSDEVEMVNLIMQKIPDFVKKYGGNPIVCAPEKIHFLKSKEGLTGLAKVFGTGEEKGLYDADAQTIYVFPSISNAMNAHAIVHETLHLNSFQSHEVDKKNPKFSEPRRRGFGIITKEGGLFNGLDEAIIEELALRFEKEYLPQIKESPEQLRAYGGPQIERSVLEAKKGYYLEERRRLKYVIGDILKKFDKFESEEEVFDIFAKAVMSGKLLEVAKLIEGTYGKGSFRKLGKETK